MANPSTVTVSVGQSVTFVNNDSVSHNMASDPHPIHTACPEINVIGVLLPGQSRATSPFTSVKDCGYHDHNTLGTTGMIRVR